MRRLALVSGILVGAAMLGHGAAAQERPDAVALVSAFTAALEQDEGAAAGMLAQDASFGVGDVGGPMTVGTFNVMMRELRQSCRLTRLGPDSRPFSMPGREIVTVTAHYRCVSTERPEGHDLAMDYLVESGRIAGVYMHGGGDER